MRELENQSAGKREGIGGAIQTNTGGFGPIEGYGPATAEVGVQIPEPAPGKSGQKPATLQEKGKRRRLVDPQYIDGAEVIGECIDCEVVVICRRTKWNGRTVDFPVGKPSHRTFADFQKSLRCPSRHKRIRYAHGRCQECGKVLSDPRSLERQIGPECWSKRKVPVEVRA